MPVSRLPEFGYGHSLYSEIFFIIKGECGEFPCALLKKFSYDPEQGDNGVRIEQCKNGKAALVTEARKGVDPVSICGHHCDYCFMGQWCGGCRSEYNCCSYAMLFSNRVCPNVACANKKHLDGCYDCEELPNCRLGFYEKEFGEGKKEYVAKATALSIRTYGKDCYSQTLKKAIASECSYPDSFDQKGSVEEALKLLESYLD